MSRIEHDLLGDRELPDDCFYGIHTLRALENFPITGIAVSAHPHLVAAAAAVKQAAALANSTLGLLAKDKAAAIVQACEEVRSGQLHDQFVVDVLQGGAGTSTNMNTNEVIANRALEILGYRRGDYGQLHPIDHVNLGQSTNDVYPTAVKVGLRFAINELTVAMTGLSMAFRAKAIEYAEVLKVGRTQLQDAVPMTVGQEMSTFATMIDEDVARLFEAAGLIAEINLGGTAIGTGLNAHPEYAALACANLSMITGIPLATAGDLIEATQDVGAFVQLSGVLKRVAVKLSKTCNDLRLLSSGPKAGFGELNLPAVQAGSSIMPGKVNPVIPEVLNQIAYRVVGNDTTVTMAGEAGQLQLNAFEPVIADSLFDSIKILTNGCQVLTDRCVTGITVNEDHLRRSVEASIGTATALNPHLGYLAATEIAVLALATGRSVRELAQETGLVTEEKLTEILSPRNLAMIKDIAFAGVAAGAPSDADPSGRSNTPPAHR